MKGEILCSVALISYNQESTIKDCLQSVLAQKIDGVLQVVVADDASSDHTFDIISPFLEDQRVLWKVLPRDTNLGMLKNWARAIDACDGEFVALLEGDDSWIMPNKLKIQIEALRQRPTLQAVVSDAAVLNERDDLHYPRYVTKYNKETTINLSEILVENPFPTCTTVFRRKPNQWRLPKFYWQSPYADWIVHVVNANLGDILYLSIQTSQYRLHNDGVFGGQDKESHLERSLWLLNQYATFYPECKEHIKSKQKDISYLLSESYRQKGRWLKYFNNRFNRFVYG